MILLSGLCVFNMSCMRFFVAMRLHDYDDYYTNNTWKLQIVKV